LFSATGLSVEQAHPQDDFFAASVLSGAQQQELTGCFIAFSNYVNKKFSSLRR
jgi:hypothetical protein